MEDESSRRVSGRTRKLATKMAAALASSDNRNRAVVARLEALESDNAAVEVIEPIDDDDASFDDDDDGHYTSKKSSKSAKRKTRQAKALENARKTPKNFTELVHEANLESLGAHIPSYLRAAVGPPSSNSRRHYCTVCGSKSNYTCVRCGLRFCCVTCQRIHDDTRCQKFVA